MFTARTRTCHAHAMAISTSSIILTPGLLEAFPAVGLQSARDCGILNVAQRLAILRLALSSWVSATLQEGKSGVEYSRCAISVSQR